MAGVSSRPESVGRMRAAGGRLAWDPMWDPINRLGPYPTGPNASRSTDSRTLSAARSVSRTGSPASLLPYAGRRFLICRFGLPSATLIFSTSCHCLHRRAVSKALEKAFEKAPCLSSVVRDRGSWNARLRAQKMPSRRSAFSLRTSLAVHRRQYASRRYSSPVAIHQVASMRLCLLSELRASPARNNALSAASRATP